MGFNPNSEAGVKRLQAALDASRKRLKRFRENRTEAIRQYVGKWYSDNGTQEKVPLNFILQAKTIYKRKLLAGTPQVLCNTRVQGMAALAADAEVTGNLRLRNMGLKSTLNKVLDDAIFSVGIIKVGWSEDGIAEYGVEGEAAEKFPLWKTYARRVSLDDWVHDAYVGCFEDCSFMGNRIRLCLDDVRESSRYDRRATDKLEATRRSAQQDGTERAENITQGSGIEQDEYEDYVELEEIYLPREKLLVTIPREGDWRPLAVEEWNGPEHGPFRMFGFSDVPDQVMPLSLMCYLRDLHELGNQLFRKLGRQANRQKTLLAYQPAAQEDAEKIVTESDGGTIPVNNPEMIKEVRFGGVDNNQLGFLVKTEQALNKQAGNLDMLGGLGPQSPTVGQDKLLSQAGNEQIAELQERFADFTGGVVNDIMFYHWHDPTAVYEADKALKDFPDLKVRIHLTPEQREGKFHILNFELVPYSLQEPTPQERKQKMVEFVSTMAPILPNLEAQGYQFDAAYFAKQLAKYENMPELGELIKIGPEPLMTQEPKTDRPSGKPANTTRNYVRRSESVDPRAQEIQSLMSSGGSNGSQ